MVLMMVVVASVWTQSAAQSGCTSALTSMSSCLNYITGSSPTPSSTCCSQLSSVVQSSPQCLCSVLNGGGSSLGITINQTLALSLPGACKIQTPPVTQCQGGNTNTPTSSSTAPLASPAESPQGSTSDIPNAGSGSGSKTVPSTDGASSHGTTIKISSLLFFMLFLSASKMRPKWDKLGLILVLVTMFHHGTEAQSSCAATLFGLSPCLSYVTGNSTTPSSSCCTQLLSVVQSQPQCLCPAALSGGGAILGFNINQTRATSLPDVCYIKAPPSSSQCGNGNGPSTSATSPPPTTASQTSIPQPSDAGAGSKTLPSTNQRSSDGSIEKTHVKLSVVAIFLVLSLLMIKM
ncbi:non-specific lipid-transfer protein-like protein [Senna tora]|uniref:Non-specific lipid-transfer protein-like protein n=1 Tax=Senna tora TaxID=362788 RepID=A0A834TCD7_9FABA|nr:non-specific lipid-transfer protein-like protein [Senna tora]